MPGATETPGVRSSSIRTRSGSMPMRDAWRYSSSRCADKGVTAAAASAAATHLPASKLRAVVIGWIAVDRVDVIEAALRCVLDHQRRPLDPEVRHAAVRRRAAPREPGLRQCRLELGHARRGEG